MLNQQEKIKKYLKLYHSNYNVNFADKKFPLDRFFLYLNQSACQSHSYLTQPARIQWEVTSRCNLNCKQCYINSSAFAKKKELTTVQAKKVIDELKAMNVLWVEIQGGEPFMRQDILEIIKYAKEQSLNLKILTNGTLLTRQTTKILATLLDKKVDSLQISLDGSTAKANDAIRGKGSFKMIIRGIKNCLFDKLFFSINSTLMNDNILDIRNIYKLLGKIGDVPKYTFFTLMKVGRGQKLDFTPETGLDLAIELKKLEKKYNKPKVFGFLGYIQHLPDYSAAIQELYKKKVKFINRNTAAISSLDIDSNGDIYPSSYLQFNELKAGNILNRSLSDIWETKKWDSLRYFSSNVYGKCAICDRKDYCNHGTVTTGYVNCQKFDMKDNQCLYQPKLETERLEFQPPEKSDFIFLKSLWEDGKVMEYVGFPKGLKQPDKKIYNWITNWSSEDKLRLIIKDKETGQSIGETGYKIDNNYPFSKSKVAAIDVKIIPEYWGKGIGTEVVKRITKHIFSKTDINIIQVTPNVNNKAAIHLYSKLGFVKKGQPEVCDKPDSVVIFQYMELKKEE